MCALGVLRQAWADAEAAALEALYSADFEAAMDSALARLDDMEGSNGSIVINAPTATLFISIYSPPLPPDLFFSLTHSTPGALSRMPCLCLRGGRRTFPCFPSQEPPITPAL